VNIDHKSLLNLMERYQDIVPAPFKGAVPLLLDTSDQTPVPGPTGLLVEAGECLVVDPSDEQAQISEHVGRFISDTLIDSTVGANGQGERHFITAGGAHIPAWYRLGPLLELEGVAEWMGFHLAKQLQAQQIDVIIPWADPGIQLAIRLASRLSVGAARQVGYVVLVKDSVSGGPPEISDLDEQAIRGKRVLLLTDVLCAGETIRKLAEEVDRRGGHVKAVAGILSFGRSTPLRNVLDSIGNKSDRNVVEWNRQRYSGLPRPSEFEGARWLSEVSDPVYPDAAQCRDCGAWKPYSLLWSTDAHGAATMTHPESVEIVPKMNRSAMSWSQFWLGAYRARSIGQVEHKVVCNHCHNGQVLDISRLREATDLWDDVTQWAGLEIENAIRAKSPTDTEPIYLVTSPSRGATILAGELVRQYDQLRDPTSSRGMPIVDDGAAPRAPCRLARSASLSTIRYSTRTQSWGCRHTPEETGAMYWERCLSCTAPGRRSLRIGEDF
jgi:orotate phosphoribosyltransferase